MWCLGYPSYRLEGVLGASQAQVFLEAVPADVHLPVLPGVPVVVAGRVGDDVGLPWGWSPCAPSWALTVLESVCARPGQVSPVCGLLPGSDGGIPLHGEEEVLAVCWKCPGVGGLGDPVEADGLQSRFDFVLPECAVLDCPFPRQVMLPVAVRGDAVLWGQLPSGDGGCEGFRVGALLCGWWCWHLGCCVSRLLLGLCCLQLCADGGEGVMEDGRGGEVWSRIVPGQVITRWVFGVPLYGDGGGGGSSGVHRCRLWSRGWSVMVW